MFAAFGEHFVLVDVRVIFHLVAGKRVLSDDLTYGQSITDACIGWDDTVVLLDQLASANARSGA